MTVDCNRIMIDAENRVCVVKDSCLGCRHKKEYCALNDMFEALRAEVPDINVGDTIYRQAAIDALDKRFDSIPMEQTAEILQLRKDLRELPSAQPEIVRCKDCKWTDGAECLRFADVRPFPHDFCSRGERKPDGRLN